MLNIYIYIYLLFWLWFCFGDSRLPYFRPVMSSKPPRKPRVELTFYSGLQFLDSLRVSQSLLNSFLYLGKLQWFPSLGQSYFYEPSVLTFRYVGYRISWKTWCSNENDGGADVISYLLLPCVLYCMEVNLSKLSRKNDNNK